MFGKLQDMVKQVQTMQKMMKDEHVKALVAHPKLMALLRDPEVAPLLSKVDPQSLLKA